MGIMGKKKERSFEKISLLPVNEDDGQIDINNGFYEHQYTVNECLEYIGFGWFQVKLTVVLGFSWMADAIAITSLAVLAPALQCDWNLSPEQTALISTCVFIGMFFGAGFWGWFCDTFGRKLALTLSASLILVSFLCSSFAINYHFVLIFMIMEGFSVAGAGQSMTMFFELLPANKRAVGLVMLGIFFVLGNVLSGLVAVFVMNQHGWRWFVRMTSIPIFILILFLWWLPESPRYLIGIGKREAAAKVLSRIADENNSQLPNGKLKILPCYQRKPRGRIIDLLKIDQRRTTTLLWFLWFSAVFCYYGVLLCTTLLLNKREKLCDSQSPFDGMKHLIIKRGGLPMTIIPVNHNTSSPTTSNTNRSIGGHCHRMTSSDYLGFLFTALGEIPGLLLCFGLADRLGRRPALSVLCFVSVLAMSLLHACLNRYLLVGTLFILRAFVTGFIQTVYLYTPEVYPTNIRAIGFGTASSMARIGAIITPFVSEVLLDTYPHHAIFIYSGLMAVCIFASLLLPIETKGMKLKEFEEESEPNDNG